MTNLCTVLMVTLKYRMADDEREINLWRRGDVCEVDIVDSDRESPERLKELGGEQHEDI